MFAEMRIEVMRKPSYKTVSVVAGVFEKKKNLRLIRNQDRVYHRRGRPCTGYSLESASIIF